ncbi:MAG: ATP-binding protein [Candidatus Krumholzibacteriia bacterium]
MTTTKPFTERTWGRWGLLLSAVILGALLMIASWSNHRSAQQATDALHNGQARVFERAIMGTLLRLEDRDDPSAIRAVVDSLLTDYRAEGLRYIAVIGPDDAWSVSTGTPSGGAAGLVPLPAEHPRYQISQVDSRVRVSHLRPRLPRLEPVDGQAPAAPPPGAQSASGEDPPSGAGDEGSRTRFERRPRGIVFEFEPLIAMRLMERARELLLFGMAAAAVMLAVAIVSWRMTRRYEYAMLRLEDQRRLSLLGEMSAVLAHEIRNPLASLKGHAQLLTETLPAASSELRKAQTVVREATRLEALTTDLLDFVRLGPVNREPVDPLELVRTAIDDVDARGFALRADGAPSRWSMDAARMRQVLVNLLRNARQATPDSATLPVISVRDGAGALVIEVRDFGPGLPAGQEARIFDPFFTTRTTGTGLGLAVARRIVEHHGGTLTAATHPEGGAVFKLELPGRRG